MLDLYVYILHHIYTHTYEYVYVYVYEGKIAENFKFNIKFLETVIYMTVTQVLVVAAMVCGGDGERREGEGLSVKIGRR